MVLKVGEDIYINCNNNVHTTFNISNFNDSDSQWAALLFLLDHFVSFLVPSGLCGIFHELFYNDINSNKSSYICHLIIFQGLQKDYLPNWSCF